MNHSASSADEYSLGSKAAGRLAVKTSVSPDHLLTFTIESFSPDPDAAIRLISQEKGSETLLYFDTEQTDAHQFTISLSLLEGLAVYKQKKKVGS